MLLWDTYIEAYIIVKGNISVTRSNNRDSNTLFISCISKISNALIDIAEDLDFVMTIHNLIEYSKDYRKTTSSLWYCYRDEPNNPLVDNYNVDLITNSTSFKKKSSVIWKTPNNDKDENNTNNFEITMPFKYLSNFWRTPDMPLINCEINRILTWFENCTLTDITRQAVVPAQGDNPARPAINAPTNATGGLSLRVFFKFLSNPKYP